MVQLDVEIRVFHRPTSPEIFRLASSSEISKVRAGNSIIPKIDTREDASKKKKKNPFGLVNWCTCSEHRQYVSFVFYSNDMNSLLKTSTAKGCSLPSLKKIVLQPGFLCYLVETEELGANTRKTSTCAVASVMQEFRVLYQHP